jgi:hypothetical protein
MNKSAKKMKSISAPRLSCIFRARLLGSEGTSTKKQATGRVLLYKNRNWLLHDKDRSTLSLSRTASS